MTRLIEMLLKKSPDGKAIAIISGCFIGKVKRNNMFPAQHKIRVAKCCSQKCLSILQAVKIYVGQAIAVWIIT